MLPQSALDGSVADAELVCVRLSDTSIEKIVISGVKNIIFRVVILASFVDPDRELVSNAGSISLSSFLLFSCVIK